MNGPLSDLDFERSARRDYRFWLVLALGALFLLAGVTADPTTNCSEGGECAPWLVPIAAVIGLGAMAMGAGALTANVSRGCRYDPLTRELSWWQGRRRGRGGESGRIAVDEIGVVRLQTDSDSSAISLYDRRGERLPWFDAEVVPWPHERWVEKLLREAPAIRVERNG